MPAFPSHPVVLCILDGWGMAPAGPANGVTQAHTPNWNRFLNGSPHSQLQASGLFVGLPAGQMGNSEVGHMTIGAGRVFMADLPRIDASLLSGELETRPAFKDFIHKLKRTGGACHLMGLLSPGGVHSHQSHLEGLAVVLKKLGIPLHIHAFLDGRDTPPQGAIRYVGDFLAHTRLPLSTLGGRYFAMDRDQRWERIEKAYNALAFADAPRTDGPLALLQSYYTQGVGDEFIPPHCMAGYAGMKEGDGLFMVNFRADRVRQLLGAFLLPEFTGFNRKRPVSFGATLAMGSYSAELSPYVPALFLKEPVTACLGSAVSRAGLKQLRMAETEKYAHVTFFLNGGEEKAFPGEDRILVPSPAVPTYDLHPCMSAAELTDKAVEALKPGKYALVVINYANADMVGHTGVQPAIAKAVETIDACLGRLEKTARETGYALVITADHGNAEQMTDQATGGMHTAHTCNPVPFVVVNGPPALLGVEDGQLGDIAPTVLSLLNLPVPVEMTGKCLLQYKQGL